MMSGLEGIKKITELNLKDKRVFIRVDFNVPIENGKIVDDFRIRAALPTIKYALEQEAKVIIASHMGRPKTDEDKKNMSLEAVAERLRELLECDVIFVHEPEGNAPKGLFPALKRNQLLLLENLRFSEGEESNAHEMASQLASYTDIYINDAFGASHRAHASIVGLPSIVKDKGIGFLIEKEITMLDRVLYKTESPFLAVLGGSKVSDKIGMIENMLSRIDTFLIGGAMAYTFLSAKNTPIGNSRVETAKLSLAKELIERIHGRDKKLLLPIDHVIVQDLKPGAEHKTTTNEIIPEGWMAVDIGPKTRQLYANEILRAATLFWNGPMGVYEMKPFDQGTMAIANAFAETNGTSIIGGGDSAAAIKAAGLEDKMDHISTGGGASLEYLEGSKLPGLEVLRQGKAKS
ncbi:MAG: phosphoglycerate kinase [Bdellovibrionales bacterium]|nr:phosphoglycerate kinase [Bdellovibrionales bacterium]